MLATISVGSSAGLLVAETRKFPMYAKGVVVVSSKGVVSFSSNGVTCMSSGATSFSSNGVHFSPMGLHCGALHPLIHLAHAPV